MEDILFASNWLTRLEGHGAVLQDCAALMARFRFHYHLEPPPQPQHRHRRCSY